jgi:hypothetical protein
VKLRVLAVWGLLEEEGSRLGQVLDRSDGQMAFLITDDLLPKDRRVPGLGVRWSEMRIGST